MQLFIFALYDVFVLDEMLKWLDGSNVQFSNWKYGRRPNITERFMAGLNVIGQWEMITNPYRFNVFKQRSIVVCKIEKGNATPMSFQLVLPFIYKYIFTYMRYIYYKVYVTLQNYLKTS